MVENSNEIQLYLDLNLKAMKTLSVAKRLFTFVNLVFSSTSQTLYLFRSLKYTYSRCRKGLRF